MAGNNKRQLSRTSIAYIAIGVALITLMTIIGASVFLKTVEIRVEGAVTYTAKEIVASSGLSAGDNLLFMDTQGISLNIREALPFVSTARVSRILPGTVLIEVFESVAVAYISFAGEIIVLDSSGRVVARSTGGEIVTPGYFPTDLIEIRGVEISEAVLGRQLRSELGAETSLQYMQDVLMALEREGLEMDVSYLDVSNITNIYFGYLGLYRVVLGGARDLRNKLGVLPEYVQQIQAMHQNSPGDIIMSDITNVTFRQS
jgi:hypothetical protein